MFRYILCEETRPGLGRSWKQIQVTFPLNFSSLRLGSVLIKSIFYISGTNLIFLGGGGGAGKGGVGDRISSLGPPCGEEQGGFICRLFCGGVLGGTDLSLAMAILASQSETSTRPTLRSLPKNMWLLARLHSDLWPLSNLWTFEISKLVRCTACIYRFVNKMNKSILELCRMTRLILLNCAFLKGEHFV